MVRMTVLGGAVVALALGCSSQYPADGGDDDQPDGGVGSDGGSDGGSGSGSGSGSGANPIAIELLPTTMKDERLDQIAFNANGPVHTHSGADVVLGGSSCPSVYKYSYLLDESAPQFGSETRPNPLAWRFRTTGGSGAITAEYRIVDEAGTPVLGWTAATKDADDSYLVTLHRSGAHGIPALNARAGQYNIELRASDPDGNSGTNSACWDHHPLAAPVKFTGLAASSDADALKTFTFLANSKVSPIMNAGEGVKVFMGSIGHSTAEPVTIKFDIPKPSVGYTKTIVNDLVFYNWPDNILCKVTCPAGSQTCEPYVSSNRRCSQDPVPLDPQDHTSSGSLTSGTWNVKVYDGSAEAAQCSVSGQTATCGLPGRITGAPLRTLAVVVRASQLEQLKPGAGTVAEVDLADRIYTGLPSNEADDQFRCYDMKLSSGGSGATHHTCVSFTRYLLMHAIDQLRLDISGPPMNVTTAIPAKDGFPASALAAPPYVPNGKVNGTGFIWDSGNDDLPGDAH